MNPIVPALLLIAGGFIGTAADSAGADDRSPRAESPLSLRMAVSETLAANPSIEGTAARFRGAEARLREVQAAWLPRAGITETIMRSDNPVFVFGSLLEQGRFAPQYFDPSFLNDPGAHTNFRVAVNVQFTVFDQLRRLNATRRARNGVTQAALAGEGARQRLRAEVISRFYGVILAEQRLDVASETVRSAEADTAAMQDRFDQGLIVEADLLGAEVQLAWFRQNLIEAESDVAIARAALSTILQRPLDEPLLLEGTVPEPDVALFSLDSAIERGMAARSDLRIAEHASDSAALQVNIARGSLLPRIDTFASWGASSDRFTGGNPDRAAGLVVAFDLFDGGRRARIEQSRAGLDAARTDVASARDQATMEIVTAWHRTNAARSRVAVASSSVRAAESAARIIRDRYENGLTLITEHLRAQTALLAAQLELLAARYDAVVGYAELLRSTGGLDDVEAFN